MSQCVTRPSPTSSLPRANWSVAGRRAPAPSQRPASVEQGDPDAWRAALREPRATGHLRRGRCPRSSAAPAAPSTICARWSTRPPPRWCPGPIATTALATLRHRPTTNCSRRWPPVSAPRASRWRPTSRFDGDDRRPAPRSTCWAPTRTGCCCCPQAMASFCVDAAADGVTVEPLTADRLLPPAGPRRAGRSPPAERAAGLQRNASSTSPRPCWPPRPRGWRGGRCETATEYAKVREQFGKPIGSFQAVKHMCAEMLLRSEQVAVAAADAAARGRPTPTIRPAVDRRRRRRGRRASTPTKANAKDCIQVLGGIGITWEHDAHLYCAAPTGSRSSSAAGRAGCAASPR